jgi:hypothetical protein
MMAGLALFASVRVQSVTAGCAILPSGLLSWWRGEENPLDAMGNANGITSFNLTYTAGKVGKAFLFDGIDGHGVGLGNPLQIQTFTIEAWVKRADSNRVTIGPIYDHAAFLSWGNLGYGFGPTHDGRLLLTKVGVTAVYSSAVRITDTNFHHVAVTKAGSNVTFYVDGVGETAPPYDPGFVFNTPLAIGARGGDFAHPFWGAIDELAVYNRALTAAEIQAIYGAGSSGKCVTPPIPTSILTHPQSQTVNAGESVTFSVNAKGSVPLAYQWFFGGNSIPSATSNVLVLSNVQPTNAGNYSVVVSNDWGTATSSNATLIVVTNPPSILTHPQSQTVNAGESVTFGVNAKGPVPLAYQWFFGGNALSSATSNVLVLSNVQPTNAGNYSVVVSNDWGTVTSSNATLTVVTNPIITLQPKSATNYEGETASFTTSASGAAPLKYQWYFNGSPLAEETTTTLTLTGVRTNQTGNYWVVVTNNYGSARSSNAVLTVVPQPVCVPLPSGAVAWWRAESNFWDSVSIHDAVPFASIFPLFTAGKVGTAFLTGVRSYFTVPASDELDVGAGEGLTMEGWVKPSSLKGLRSICEWSDSPREAGAGLRLNNNLLEGYLTDTNTAPTRRVVLRSPEAVLTNTAWTHVALTFDKTSGLATLLINGISVAQTNLNAFRPQTKAPVYFGVGAGDYFSGGLDEFTIYNRALTSTEILAIVAADKAGKCVPPLLCAPPPSDFIAWWRGESNALDNVDGNHGVIWQAIAFTNGVVGRGFQFNGGYIQVHAASNLDVGLSDGLTVEAWVKRAGGLLQPLIEWNSGTGTQGVNLAIINTSALQANLVSASGVAHLVTSGNISLTFGHWQHVALIYDKLSGFTALYLNGNPVAQTNLGSFTPLTRLPLHFGYRPPGSYTGSGAKFTGAMDEISLYPRALTAAEISAIVKARGEGKCKDPPAIVTQPASLRVNVGADAQFNAVVTGNPILHYQWLKEDVVLTDAVGPSLLLPAVQDANAGSYTLRVTNWFGSVFSSNAVLKVNHSPVADASATVTPVLSPLQGLATVVLDGSRSSDPDGDPLKYTWWLDSDALATGMVAVAHLPAGHPVIALVVDDGLARSTNVITVAVLTPAQAIERLMSAITASVPRSQPLLATLRAALASVNRGDPTPAVNQLQAFQNKVRVQVSPLDPALAQTFIQAAQTIIDALNAGPGKAHGRITHVSREADGKTRLKGEALPGALYIIEASSNLVDWEKIGVVSADGVGVCEFEDPNVARVPARFYRIVSP